MVLGRRQFASTKQSKRDMVAFGRSMVDEFANCKKGKIVLPENTFIFVFVIDICYLVRS